MKKPVIVQGHRGARGLFPENTITGFTGAVQLGVDVLEMDVVVSGDGKIVVSHEPWMNPLICLLPGGKEIPGDGRQYNLYRMDYAEIACFDCGTKGHPKHPHQLRVREHKPLLSEVFRAVETYTREHRLRPVGYNIEIKSEPGDEGLFQPDPKTFVRLLYEELRQHSCLDRIYLQSFDVRILQEIRATDPGQRIALLVENEEGLESNLHRLGFQPDIYSPGFWLVDQQLTEGLKQRKVQLIPWTVNRIADMKQMLDRGVDGIISDYPDRLIGLLKNS